MGPREGRGGAVTAGKVRNNVAMLPQKGKRETREISENILPASGYWQMKWAVAQLSYMWAL